MSRPPDGFSPAQRNLLELMGARVWKPRSPGGSDSEPAAALPLSPPSVGQSAAPLPPSPASAGESAAAPPPRPASASGPAAQDRPAPAPSPLAAALPPELEALKSVVAACTACPLHAGRRQTVFGVGNPNADWMFVGEGPGEEEDRRGEPFVGRAGKLLDNMLRAMELDRDTVYIANIVKCRPPGNRNPSLEETAACIPYLHRQIELIGPRLIVALGAVAAQRLLDTDQPVGALRGALKHAERLSCPVLVTYHPAYLLRSPGQKRKAWDDLQLAMREMEALRQAPGGAQAAQH